MKAFLTNPNAQPIGAGSRAVCPASAGHLVANGSVAGEVPKRVHSIGRQRTAANAEQLKASRLLRNVKVGERVGRVTKT